MSWDPPYDPVCGSTLLKGGLCKVYLAEKKCDGAGKAGNN